MIASRNTKVPARPSRSRSIVTPRQVVELLARVFNSAVNNRDSLAKLAAAISAKDYIKAARLIADLIKAVSAKK
jgi:chromosomal replication initiation ATPase DnaA